jgi:hypothetical protein
MEWKNKKASNEIAADVEDIRVPMHYAFMILYQQKYYILNDEKIHVK